MSSLTYEKLQETLKFLDEVQTYVMHPEDFRKKFDDGKWSYYLNLRCKGNTRIMLSPFVIEGKVFKLDPKIFQGVF